VCVCVQTQLCLVIALPGFHRKGRGRRGGKGIATDGRGKERVGKSKRKEALGAVPLSFIPTLTTDNDPQLDTMQQSQISFFSHFTTY